MADREVPCRVKGCKKTWTWFGSQQVRALGEAPPARMCDDHLEQFHDLEDKEIPCRNAPSCAHTWTWKRGAQLHAVQSLSPSALESPLQQPSRLCAQCYESERRVENQELTCKVAKCERTWTWDRDAQLRHRAWLRRQLEQRDSGEAAGGDTTKASEPSVDAKAAGEDAGAGEGRRRKRKPKRRKPKVHDGPPEKMCKVCAVKYSRIRDIELPCKVHGCGGSAVWDRMSQLRAFAAKKTDDIEYNAPLPKRMCNRCRDFCRDQKDKHVACGSADCERTWLYKTGAQLQAFLAGQREDPIRLCDVCVKQQYTRRAQGNSLLEAGAESMPCVVSGCAGTWIYTPGMKLAPAQEGETPADRMCDPCRIQRELEPRQAARTGSSEPTPQAENPTGDSRASADEAEASQESEAAVPSTSNTEAAHTAGRDVVEVEVPEVPEGSVPPRAELEGEDVPSGLASASAARVEDEGTVAEQPPEV